MKNTIFVLLSAFIFLMLAPFSGVNATISAAINQNNVLYQNRRAAVLYNFLEGYNSPLKNYSRNFVEDADKYNLDYRLLVAISGVESTFAKQLPYNSYNAWGWGIYGNNMIRFSSYPEAIATISKTLRENYIDQWGAKNVYQIGRFYAASPTWAQRVVYFMGKIEDSNLQFSL